MKLLGRCLMVAAMLVGCDGGGDLHPEPDAHGGSADGWIGNWNQSGTQSTTCGAQTATTQLSDLVVISAQSKIDTIKTLANNCPLIWNLDGANAALASGQVCTVSVNGFNVTITWTQSSARLNGDVITANTTGATNNGCTFMQQITMTRS